RARLGRRAPGRHAPRPAADRGRNHARLRPRRVRRRPPAALRRAAGRVRAGARVTSEQHGVRPGAVLAFVDAVEREVRHAHGFVLLRRGAVVAEGYWDPYRADRPHMQFSLAKSLTSTAVGLLVGEGRLSVDDRLVDVFPELAPEAPSERL